MSVPSLRELLRGLVAETVVQEGSSCLGTDLAATHLLLTLDQGAWGAESKAVLDRIVCRYPLRLTPKIVLALLPSNATEISLKECPLVTEACINGIIERCPLLQSMDLAGNEKLNFGEIHLFQQNGGTFHQSLAHVSLEDCFVSDQTIQALLWNAPMLQSLNIARCHITDKVFLLNETKQLAREGGFQHSSLSTGYDSQLQSVDVTGCDQFSSTGVRHLCTLCGPSLTVLNMSWTKVDSTTLIYLCGLGLPAVVQFYLSLEEQAPEVRQKPGGSKGGATRREALLETLTQFEHIAAQLRDDTQQPSQLHNGKLEAEDLESLKNQSASSGLQGSPCVNPPVSNLFSDTELSEPQDFPNLNQINAFDGSEHPVSAHIPEDISCEDAVSEDHSPLAASNLQSLDDAISLTNVEVRLDSGNCAQTRSESIPPASRSNTSCDSSDQGLHASGSNSNIDIQISQPSLGNLNNCSKTLQSQIKDEEKCPNISRTESFFTPNIKELCISGTVFADAPASHHCFRKFLESNPGLATLRLMGGLNGQSVTDEVLAQVTETSHALRHMSVEGCLHLTTAGVAGLAACTQLEHLDLTGVAFVEDAGLIHLIKRLSLTGLLIAETRVKNRGLTTLASQPACHKLQELELSWCEDLEDDKGLNAVASSCSCLRRLVLRECGLSTRTMELIAANCRNLTELSLACCDLNIVCDESVILLSENLLSLEVIDLSWNSNLTNASVGALLANCCHLTTANLSGLKRITAEPFASIIAVPEELSWFLTAKQKEWESNESLKIMLSDLPCLPHRSTIYATHLVDLQLQYSDFVQDQVLDDIVAITLGSIKIVDYYGSEVTISDSDGVLETFVMDLFHKKCFGNTT